MMRTLGARIKEERERHGWTQIYMAKKIDATPAMLSHYERDFRDPDTDMLVKIADVLEVTADYLLGRTNYRNTEEYKRTLAFAADWTDDEKTIATATVRAFRQINNK